MDAGSRGTSYAAPAASAAPEVPASILNPEQTARLNEVRRELWRGGMRGAAAGVVTGLCTLVAVKNVSALKGLRNKNMYTALMLASPVMGALVGSTVSGKNEIQLVGDIFDTNKKFSSDLSYSSQLQANKEAERVEREGAFERRQATLRANAVEREKAAAAAVRN